ncbi:MAG: GNAT family N-acetyltransferase [Fimbriimonadaceae bacterium]
MLSRDGLTLRAVEAPDLDALHRWENDLEFVLAGGGDPPAPYSREKIEAQMAQSHSPSLDFAIVMEGRLIGRCGLYRQDRLGNTIMLGIGIGEKEEQGKGYGRIAVDLLLELAFRYHNYRKVWLQVWSGNEPAIRCYAACGLVEVGRFREHVWGDGRYQDLVSMGILKCEWEAGRT